MDFIVGLPRTQRQKDTILVVLYCLSKMDHFIPTKETMEAPQVSDLFIKMYSNYMDYHFLLSQIEMCDFADIFGDIFLLTCCS